MENSDAFVPGPRLCVAPTGMGPLDGLTFVVKDLFDIAGQKTGGGNPSWLAAAQRAKRTAPTVTRLLAAGARMVGRTTTDELAFSLEGANAHYGTPVNPAAPGRLPGGSSSGSAVAVAAGLSDFALGTDTGGSVRVPASFCGIHGFRPTHGKVSVEGVLPFAPSYDTIGWFASSGVTLRQVGEVILGREETPPIDRVLVAEDAFALADARVADSLLAVSGNMNIFGSVNIFESEEADWLEAYRILQGREIHLSLGARIEEIRPVFGEAIARRFADAAAITPEDADLWRPARNVWRKRLDALLPPGTAILLPSAPTTALRTDAGELEVGDFYGRALTLNSIASHGGLPQRQIPAGFVDGFPIGLSVIGGAGSDLALLAVEPGN